MKYCSLLGVQSVAEMARPGRLRKFGHLEHKSGDCMGMIGFQPVEMWAEAGRSVCKQRY